MPKRVCSNIIGVMEQVCHAVVVADRIDIANALRLSAGIYGDSRRFEKVAMSLGIPQGEAAAGMEAVKAFASHFADVLSSKPLPSLVVMEGKATLEDLERAHNEGRCKCGDTRSRAVH